MNTNEHFMRRCLDLASFAAGSASPNPMVGAVVVSSGNIVGEGFTSPYGGAHAEVNAINNVLSRYGEDSGRKIIKGSTVYVSLEPCSHIGKTPPCTDLLIRYQVEKVVVGCIDPFSSVNGAGVSKLRDAGIEVEVGVLEKECRFVNRRFFTRIEKNRPYIVLKWAETKDGFFAPLDPIQKWISNDASKQLVHKWRSEEDAILIGVNTARTDNPGLNTRLWKGKSPKRILIDKDLSLPESHDLFKNKETDLLVFNAVKTDWNESLKYIQLENFDLYLPQSILYQLFLMDIQSVIIEGGVKTLNSFIETGLWDEARVFIGSTTWNVGRKAPDLPIPFANEIKVGSDRLLLSYNS